MAYGHDPRSNSCLFLIDCTGQNGSRHESAVFTADPEFRQNPS